MGRGLRGVGQELDRIEKYTVYSPAPEEDIDLWYWNVERAVVTRPDLLAQFAKKWKVSCSEMNIQELQAMKGNVCIDIIPSSVD